MTNTKERVFCKHCKHFAWSPTYDAQCRKEIINVIYVPSFYSEADDIRLVKYEDPVQKNKNNDCPDFEERRIYKIFINKLKERFS